MSTHNIGFYEEIRKIIFELSSNTHLISSAVCIGLITQCFIFCRRHTCDTFLNPNREIWNFWSGNLCLVSGGFHVANFGLFYRS